MMTDGDDTHTLQYKQIMPAEPIYRRQNVEKK